MARRIVRKKASPKPIGALASAVDVTLPERRQINFFVRVKKSNADWIKHQAKAHGICNSEYMDLLIEKIKTPDQATAR